jgi:hypothetical protein
MGLFCGRVGQSRSRVAGYGFPNASIDAPPTLILTHIVAIGWPSLPI